MWLPSHHGVCINSSTIGPYDSSSGSRKHEGGKKEEEGEGQRGDKGNPLILFLSSFESQCTLLDAHLSSSLPSHHEVNTLREVLRDLLTLLSAANERLHPRHIALARLHTLIMTTCRSLIPILPSLTHPSSSPLTLISPPLPSLEDPALVAIYLIRSALELKETQDLYCGSPYHYDLSITLEDLFVTMEY